MTDNDIIAQIVQGERNLYRKLVEKYQPSAPQANPLTNISGGATGYFGTFAVSKKRVIIK